MNARLVTMECPRCIGIGAVVLVVYPEVRSSGCDNCAGTGRVPATSVVDNDGFSDVVVDGLGRPSTEKADEI